MQIAENICSQFHPFANNVRQIAFLKHQQRRKVAPWAMVSLCHDDIRFIRTNLNIFAPSVTKFKDQTRYHPDRKFMDYFLIHYYMDALLRKIFLDGNLDVGLPIRTMPNQLIYYARSIFEWFNARTGVEPPHFILLSANDRVESTAL